MKKINIPKKQNDSIETIIERNMTVVGANGAGKTRFGSRIEQININSKRISAQRSLWLDERVTKDDFERASSQLNANFKNQTPIQPQNDYQQVLISLFAEESKRDHEVIVDIKNDKKITPINLPKSIKEQVNEVWDFIFPYRKLKLENDLVRAVGESEDFSANEMSDGEKVGLYLISQILLADKDCLLIIDEPELHLHKALMTRLWNKLEEVRSDCVFIYITHDLGFAVSKPSDKIIWIKEYKNSIWDWIELDSNGVVPEDLFLEILGSRKPILLVEGDKGSLDNKLYQIYYNNFTVIPRGFSSDVILSVKGLRSNKELHDKDIFGIIDMDFRSKSQLNKFKKQGIFSIKVNEVENIFLIPEIIEIVCKKIDMLSKIDDIISEIRESYRKDKIEITFLTLKLKMRNLFNQKFDKINTMSEYDDFKKIVFEEMNLCIPDVVLPDPDGDILDILSIYPNKGLVGKVQCKLSLVKNEYIKIVLNLLSSGEKNDIKKVLKKYLPEIKK